MIIINYHQLSIRGASSRYDMPRRLFRRQIDALIGHGFSFVTPEELLLSSSEERPRQCAITFDDGRLGAYEHGATILREYGIRATYFICPDWLETKPTARRECYSDFMTWDHVAELAREGHVIASHGKSHLPLLQVEAESAVSEIWESKRLIEQKLGTSCDHFAAPWGQINRTVTRLVRECGYKTLSSTVQGPNKVPYELHRLRRLDGSRYRSLTVFDRAIRRNLDAHSRFNVVLLDLAGKCARRAAQINAIARFDLAVCLSEPSYEFCVEAGVPCLRHRFQPGSTVRPLEGLLLKAHGEMVRDREITFTPLTLRESYSPWTYLSSFLPGTSRIP